MGRYRHDHGYAHTHQIYSLWITHVPNDGWKRTVMGAPLTFPPSNGKHRVLYRYLWKTIQNFTVEKPEFGFFAMQNSKLGKLFRNMPVTPLETRMATAYTESYRLAKENIGPEIPIECATSNLFACEHYVRVNEI